MEIFKLQRNGLEGQNKKVHKFLFKPLPSIFCITIPTYDLTKYCTIEYEGKNIIVVVRTVAHSRLVDVVEYVGKFEFLSALRALAKEMYIHSGKQYRGVVHCLENNGLKQSITALDMQKVTI